MSVAVEPLRDTFLTRLRAEREDALADAERRAEAIVADAHERGRALVEAARGEGAAAADAAGSQECAQARRRARELVLGAQRELYDELRQQAIDAALALRATPGYRALVQRLARYARRQLGAHATVETDPAGVGGVRASKGARTVDYTLPALALRYLEWLGSDVGKLWR